MSFEYREHTGESWIVATGDTLEAAFGEGARALFNIMVPLDQIAQSESRSVECEAESLDRLFFEWLNELILLKDVDGLIFSSFYIKSIHQEASRWVLNGTALGEVYNSDKHESHVDVKAATFSELKCDETADGYEVGCVLDI